MAEQWQCPKCEHTEFDTDEITATGSGLSKFFNVQNRKFTAVTCRRCAYTEFYRGETSALGNIVDFLGN
ncbi:zinc ribbon domain-containing protein [Kordiimonas sp.]|uniref:zinc ribbon domain-containing protein n=1 Tax=Kordiimonas sp. TaxID=1970157 RepID=UPI003A90D19B